MLHLLTAIYLLFSACSSSQIEDIHHATIVSKLNPNKVLIVYLSRTNNTKAIAEIIHQHVGGKLVPLELEEPYPQDYRATVQQVAKENETGFLPPLKTQIDTIQNYNVVFIGFPTWGMQLPPPIKSFLKQYSLSGKTIIPFNTNGGYGIGSSFQTVRSYVRTAKYWKALLPEVDWKETENIWLSEERRQQRQKLS